MFKSTSSSLPSTKGTSSSMSETELADKDEIIDHLQEKVGELLSVKQELCLLKNENETMKSQIVFHEKALSDEKEKSFELECSLNSEKQRLQTTINSLTEENRQQSRAINALTQEVKSYQKTLQEVQTSSDESSKQHEETLNATINENKNITKSLQDEIQTLNEQWNTSKQEIQRFKDQLNDANNTIQQLKTENQKIRQEYQENIQKYNENKKILTATQKENDNLANKVQFCEMKNSQLEIDIKKSTVELESTKTELENNKKEMDQVKLLLPNHDNLDEIVQSITFLNESAYKLKKDTKKKDKKILLCKQVLVQQQELIEQKDIIINEMKTQISAIQNELSQEKEKQTEFEKKQQKYDMKKKFVDAINKANKQLTSQLYELKNVISPQVAFPTFRNVIISIIFARRWRTLLGCEPNSTSDTRNWWWLVKEKQSAKDEILQAMQNNIQAIEKTSKDCNELDNFVKENQNTIKEANKVIAEKEATILNERKRADAAINKMKQLETQLSIKIDRSVHEELEQKYNQMKEKFSNAIHIMEENENIISDLRNRLVISEDRRDKNGMNASAASIEIKHLQEQLTESRQEIEILNLALTGKRKEILSLERGIFSEQRSKAALKSQCYTLASENQNLARNGNRDYIPEQKRLDERTLGSRLREMSRNMTGTLF